MRNAMVAFGAVVGVTLGALLLLVGAAVRLDREALGMAQTWHSAACVVTGVACMAVGVWAAWRARMSARGTNGALVAVMIAAVAFPAPIIFGGPRVGVLSMWRCGLAPRAWRSSRSRRRS